MKLRLTLAAMLAFSLACSSFGGGSTEATDGTSTHTTPPPPPPNPDAKPDAEKKPEKLPPPADGMTAAERANKAAAEAAQEGGEEGGEEGEEKVEFETKMFEAVVKVPRADRIKLRDVGTKRLEKDAEAAGFPEVKKVKMGAPDCDDTWCSVAITGEARRVKAAEGAATEGEAAE